MEPYKERMVKEYRELVDRLDKLGNIIVKAQGDLLDFELSCPLPLLQIQYDIMWAYKSILEMRAEIEGIDL